MNLCCAQRIAGYPINHAVHKPTSHSIFPHSQSWERNGIGRELYERLTSFDSIHSCGAHTGTHSIAQKMLLCDQILPCEAHTNQRPTTYKEMRIKRLTAYTHLLLNDPTMVSDLFNIPKKSTGLRGYLNRRRDKNNNVIEIRSAAIDFLRTLTDDNDTSTISLYSTNSTVDDNPGTGRLIDKHIYQRLGRKLERFLFWIKPPMLTPGQICAFFEKQNGGHGIFYSLGLTSRGGSIVDSFRDRSSVYGLKCLIKQTQLVLYSRFFYVKSVTDNRCIGRRPFLIPLQHLSFLCV